MIANDTVSLMTLAASEGSNLIVVILCIIIYKLHQRLKQRGIQMTSV